MTKTPSAVIRKIVVGNNPKDGGLAFVVDKRTPGDNKIITDIVEDLNQFLIFGRVRFLIYVKIDGEVGTKLWKALDGVPVTIEYDLKNTDVIV